MKRGSVLASCSSSGGARRLGGPVQRAQTAPRRELLLHRGHPRVPRPMRMQDGPRGRAGAPRGGDGRLRGREPARSPWCPWRSPTASRTGVRPGRPSTSRWDASSRRRVRSSGLGSYDLLLGPEALGMAAPGRGGLFAAGREAYPGGRRSFRLGGGSLGPFSWGGKTLRLVFLSQSAPGGTAWPTHWRCWRGTSASTPRTRSWSRASSPRRRWRTS